MPVNLEDVNSVPGLGTKIPHAGAMKSVCHNYGPWESPCSSTKEATPMRSPHIPPRENRDSNKVQPKIHKYFLNAKKKKNKPHKYSFRVGSKGIVF